jgi:Protein of unknown function (DUF3325)
MAEGALAAAAFASSYFGFALLALRQKPHHSAVSRNAARAAPPRALERRCLALGGASLALGFALSLLAEGPSFGSILWVLSLGAAALAVMFTLTYRPHWLGPVQRVLSPTGRG